MSILHKYPHDLRVLFTNYQDNYFTLRVTRHEIIITEHSISHYGLWKHFLWISWSCRGMKIITSPYNIPNYGRNIFSFLMSITQKYNYFDLDMLVNILTARELWKNPSSSNKWDCNHMWWLHHSRTWLQEAFPGTLITWLVIIYFCNWFQLIAGARLLISEVIRRTMNLIYFLAKGRTRGPFPLPEFWNIIKFSLSLIIYKIKK